MLVNKLRKQRHIAFNLHLSEYIRCKLWFKIRSSILSVSSGNDERNRVQKRQKSDWEAAKLSKFTFECHFFSRLC